MRPAPDHCCPWTGALFATVRRRSLEIPDAIIHPDVDLRAKKLRHVLANGAAWELSSGQCLDAFLAVVKSKNAYKAKRLGTNAVKKQELLDNPSAVLSEEQCTAYRARSARANYLTADRPDPCFAAK